MPRIRTIKPEFPHSESMGNVSRDARLTFVLLWTIADDSGRARASSRMLASLLFPYDDDAPKLIDSWLTELENQKCIRRYDIDGTHYLQIQKWEEHQKIDRPTASKIPLPREDSSSARDDSRGLVIGSKDQGSGSKDQGSSKPPPAHARTREEPAPPPPVTPQPSPAPAPKTPPTAYQRIFERAVELQPGLATANPQAIHDWLNAGCQVERDILPAIEALGTRPGLKVSAFKYFTEAVMENKRVYDEQKATEERLRRRFSHAPD